MNWQKFPNPSLWTRIEMNFIDVVDLAIVLVTMNDVVTPIITWNLLVDGKTMMMDFGGD